jgi:N-acetylmuramoyl-L-alanine amidase
VKRILLCLTLLGAFVLTGCSTTRRARPGSGGDRLGQSAAPAAVNLRPMIVPKGRVGRRVEFPLRASSITIHSTSNRNATALQHARGMANGAFRGKSKWNRTGYMTWHFTVDDVQAIQSLPLNIQGEHADHDGPGNTTSIGIEICEFRDRRRQAAAIDRAARLTAWLAQEKGIPLDRVVPHYHWPQWHFHGHQKNCPRILLDGGRPGARWAAFLRKVQEYQ